MLQCPGQVLACTLAAREARNRLATCNLAAREARNTLPDLFSFHETKKGGLQIEEGSLEDGQ